MLVIRSLYRIWRGVVDFLDWYYVRFIIHPIFSISVITILLLIFGTNFLFGEMKFFPLIILFIYISLYILKSDFVRIFVFLAIAILLSGNSLFSLSSMLAHQEDIALKLMERLNSEHIAITVDIGNRVKQKATYQIVWGREVDSGASLYMQFPRYPEVKRWSECEVGGTLTPVDVLEDFGEYIRKNGSYLYLKVDRFNCNLDDNFHFQYSLYKIKDWVVRNIEGNISEPNASLLIGIMFGDDRVYSKEFAEDVKATGLTHIVAASGYNISFVASMFIVLFRYLPNRVKDVVVGVCVGLYTFIAGGGASVIRAFDSHLLAVISNWLGLMLIPLYLLILLGVTMVLVRPLYFFDIGFQLSFLATFAIVFVSPTISSYIRVNKELLVPTVCSVMVLPILSRAFGEASVISFVSNYLVLGSIQYLMPTGVLFSFITLLLPSTAAYLSHLIDLQFVILSYVVKVFGSFNYAVIPIGYEISVIMVIAMLAVTLVVFRGEIGKKLL